MSSLKRILASVLVVIVVLQGVSQVVRHRYSAPDAIANNRARISVTGNGSSSGDSIRVRVAKGPDAPAGPIEISMPPGTRLGNGNSSGQDMIVGEVRGRQVSESSYARTSEIVVASEEPVTYILSAFCANFDKDNPSSSDRFTVGGANPVLACIMRNSRNLSVPARQAAVWIYTDEIDYAHMSQKFRVSPEEFNQGQQVFNACQ